MGQKVKLLRRTIDLELDGKEYQIRFPRVPELKYFQEMLKRESEENVDIDAIVNFLDKLGLPKEVGQTLEIDHFDSIFEVFNKKKK